MIVRARSAGVTVAVHASTAAAPTAVARARRSTTAARPKGRTGTRGRRCAGATRSDVGARGAANAAARELDADDEDEVDPAVPEAGDVVEHFAFGICDVLTAEGERLRIRDVNGPIGVREVSLDMLTVMGPPQETEANGSFGWSVRLWPGASATLPVSSLPDRSSK